MEVLRWLKPAWSGDMMRAKGQALTIKSSRSKPDRGVLHYKLLVINQFDESVMSMMSMQILRCKVQT